MEAENPFFFFFTRKRKNSREPIFYGCIHMVYWGLPIGEGFDLALQFKVIFQNQALTDINRIILKGSSIGLGPRFVLRNCVFETALLY